MTVKEAIQSEVEYENGSIIDKVILDVGLTGSDSYDPDTHKDLVLEATAYVMIAAARSPEFKESNKTIKYNPKQLLSQARSILESLGIDTSLVAGLSGLSPTISSGGYM